MADRKGSSARLAPYGDGGLFITKFAGKGHWESHIPGDELIHIVDGTTTWRSWARTVHDLSHFAPGRSR
jgi:hypothetical protein